MKKIIACIFAVTLITTAAFSKNFFSSRFFEVKVGADVDFSNNLFALNDFMKRDLVIDLPKIADDCPDGGFNIRADAASSIELGLNIKDFHLGFSNGMDLYESVSLGKDIFDFLGYGNEIGDVIDIDYKNNTDIFLVSQFDVGFKVGKLKFNVQPALFLPLISIRESGGYVKILNDSDGNLFVSMDTEMSVYAVSDLKSTGDNVELDTAKIESTVITGYGFDLGGTVSYPFSDSLSLDATCRIPLIPGHLSHKATVTSGSEYNVKLTDFENSEKVEKEMQVINEDAFLAVHRPLKLDVYLDKNILGSLFNFRGGAGIGIRRPFSDVAVFYPEYYLGFTLNLVDIFKVGVSTEYTDQVFIHQLGTTVNVRVFQLDLGFSTQSTSFTKSLAVAGLGAYVYVTMGF